MIANRVSAAMAVLALALLAAPPVLAQDAGWYIGGNGGLSVAKIDDRRISAELLNDGFATPSINDNERKAGFKLFGGYRFGRYFALEGGYYNLGKFGFTADTLPPGTLDGTIKLQGANFDAVGMLPFTERFSAFGRFGAAYTQTRDRFAGTGAVNVLDPTARSNSTNYKFGGGLEYDITAHLGTRMEFERYRVDDAVGNHGSIDLFSLGLLYRFGAAAAPAPAPMVVMAAPPAWVAPEQSVEMQPVVQPVLVRKDVVFVFEQLHFQFNRSDLTPESIVILRRSIRIMHDSPATIVRLAGYASAKGTEEYNRKLSERRAHAVEAYLISHGQIAPERLTIIGYGDSRPEEYEAQPADINSDAARANMRVRFEVID